MRIAPREGWISLLAYVKGAILAPHQVMTAPYLEILPSTGLSIFDQTREPCGTDTQTTPGYKRSVEKERADSGRARSPRKTDMFARAVVIKVQPGCEVELARTFEQEVIPRFRKEEEFRGLLTFPVPDGTEALSLSLWDQKEISGAS